MRSAALVTSGVEATSLPHRDRALLGAQFFSQFAPIHWSDLLAVDIRVHSKRSPPREAMEPNPLNEPLTEFLSRHGDSLRQTVNLGNCGNYGMSPTPSPEEAMPFDLISRSQNVQVALQYRGICVGGLRKDRIVMPMWLDLKRLGKNRQNSRSRRVDHFPAPWCESGSVSGRHWSSA
jgi:hypothetical protein